MFLFWLQLIHWWSLLFPVSLLLFHQCGQLVAKHCLKISTYQPSPQGWNHWTALHLCILPHLKLLLLRIQDLQIQGLWRTYGKPGLVLISAVACEQALLFGQAKRASRERAPSRLRRSLARSRAVRLARPNRRACSQAITAAVTSTT